MRSLTRLLPLALVLAACIPTVDTGDGGTGPIVVGPKGGIFVRDGIVLDIPAGAVTQADTVISVSTVDTGVPEINGRKRISLGYKLSPTTLTLAAPITLYLTWIAERVPPAIDPATYDMRRDHGSSFTEALPGVQTISTPSAAVEAPTQTLGLFWITSPLLPNIDRLEITPSTATLALGQTQQFTARVVSPTGETVDTPVTWAVVPSRVGSIDTTGLFTAKGAGAATITAKVGTTTATATVLVPGAPSGPATFVHENPFPTGNDLYGGMLAPQGLGTVYVGANATVLAQAPDGGWSRLFSNPGLVLTDVGGTTAADAVAIGNVNETTGVLVEFQGTGAPPKVTTYGSTATTSCVPKQLWFDGRWGMAVGTGNNVLIKRPVGLDGGASPGWALEYSPSFEDLLDVVGDGQGTFVTVGNLGSLYQYDPTHQVWNSLYQTRLAVQLEAATLVDAQGTEAWAVGGDKLWHFTHGAWAAENLPSTPALDEATALGRIDGQIIVAGRVAQQGYVWAYTPPASDGDGGVTAGSWVSTALKGLQVPRGVFGAGTGGSVVGDLGSIWAWDHTSATFQEVSHGFYGTIADLAVVGEDVFVAVNECTTPACTARSGVVRHRSAAGGFEFVGATQSFNEPLFAIAANGPSDVLVTGTDTVWHWDGTAFTPVTVSGGLPGPIYDVKLCGTSWFAVGQGGYGYSGTGTTLDNLGSITGGSLYAVNCPTPEERWVAGDYYLAENLAGSGWVPKSTTGINQALWKAVWAPGGGEAFALGRAVYGLYWDSTQFLPEQGLPLVIQQVNGLWGTSVDNLYAVGVAKSPYVSGFAMRFNGISWQLIDAASQHAVTAIDGTDLKHMWLGTEGGGLLRVP
jgi:hypothetical protein